MYCQAVGLISLACFMQECITRQQEGGEMECGASKEDYMVSCAAECSGAVKGWGVQGQIKVLPEKPVIAFPPLCEMEATKVQRRCTPLGVRWWAV